MEEIWNRTGTHESDARVKWELKWAATKQFLKEKNKEDRRRMSQLQLKVKELQQKRQDFARVNERMADGSLTTLEQEGRSIADKILNFFLSQEWADRNKQPSLFIKLDFEKAYDRIDHSYLWSTMEAQGFVTKFVSLAKGLVEGSTSKLHINGSFSKEI
ncbi:hypothetical protein R1sor_012901 [Riccia sorocarpa]|uniref:Reverse transcriptase domain-containing protein n=1 Tax=Riccia sorocarpa TaxID=122646 RepID=A0ABD3I8V8_9MARC